MDKHQTTNRTTEPHTKHHAPLPPNSQQQVQDLTAPLFAQEYLFYPLWWLRVSGFFDNVRALACVPACVVACVRVCVVAVVDVFRRLICVVCGVFM